MTRRVVNRVVRKTTLNLDEIFGDVFTNLVGENITPTKIAIFYLIRQLFRSHFGYRAVPSTRQLMPRQKTKFYTFIFGLIHLEKEMKYEDFRRILRCVDKEVREGTYYTFVTTMEQLARGEMHVDIQIEDSLWTGKREYHENAVYELPPKPLMFMNMKCFTYFWIKRIMAQWIRCTLDQRHKISEDMQRWILGKPTLLPILEYDIECSSRARLWITDQIKTIQTIPSKAMPYYKTLAFCRKLKRRHVDIFSVHLLEAVVHVQLQNPPQAIEAIKTFFDLSMFKLNENVVNASQTHKMAVPCQKPLRYAPLLHGRICRIFGDGQTGQALLKESVQQAQVTLDDTCNRIANIELAAIELLNGGPLLERKTEYKESDIEKDKRILQQDKHKGADLDEHVSVEMFAQDPEEGFELHEQLITIAKMLSVSEDMLNGFFSIKSAEIMETGLRINSCSDHATKTRQVDDCAMALATSNMLRNGMYHGVEKWAETLLNLNFKADWKDQHETEAMAIGAVNLAYCSVAKGDYPKAMAIIQKLEERYKPDVNWQAAQHVSICKIIIGFERSFLDSDYVNCENYIGVLMSFSSIEATLRKALILATIGEFTKAITTLTSFKCCDIVGCIRIQMQLASIYMTCGKVEQAEYELTECAKTVTGVSLRNLRSMVARRSAIVLSLKNKSSQALSLLLSAEESLKQYGTATELCLLYYQIATLFRLKGINPCCNLARARQLSVKIGWKAMEKMILAEVCSYFESVGSQEHRNLVGKLFAELEGEKSAPFSWMLV